MEKEKPRRIGNLINDMITFSKLYAELEKMGRKASLGRAAEKLEISQSAVSECLRRLKEAYGASLIETHERSTDLTITEAGKVILKEHAKFFEIHDRIKKDINDTICKENSNNRVIRISTSPYLLAHVFPEAVSSFTRSDPSLANIRIECEEGYNTKQVLAKINARSIDFAVLWNYPEKIEEIANDPEITCALSSRKLDPVIVFGNSNSKFKDILEKGKDKFVNIEELAAETLYVLEPDHQPLGNRLPPIDDACIGKRIEVMSIASMIGSLRSGMPGAAIVPGIYKELDKYRRDGSLYYLPLRSKQTKELHIEIIYVFRGTKFKLSAHDVIPNLGKDATAKLRENPSKFLEFIDKTVLPGLLQESGWRQDLVTTKNDHSSIIAHMTFDEISTFKYAYHVSPPRIGLDKPEWHYSIIDWTKATIREGSFVFEADLEIRKKSVNGVGRKLQDYHLIGEVVGNRVFSIKGKLKNRDEVSGFDAFVANLNIVSPNGDYLIGIASGQDDFNTSGMSCSFVLSKKGLTEIGDLEQELHVARIHTLLRTDVSRFNFYKDL